MTGLTAQDALTTNIVAVGEEMRPFDVDSDSRCEVYAVFKELPSSLTSLQPQFLGLVERERVGCHPLRIFADLISSGKIFTLERSTPLAHVMSRFQHYNDTAVAVLGSPQQFVGVVTRRSLLETLLEHTRDRRSCDGEAQAGSTTSSSAPLPVEDTTPTHMLRGAVQRSANEWILDESRERRRLACDIHDRLRQHLFVARLHLNQTQQPSVQGLASAGLRTVDQLLEESLAYTRLLIEELTPSGLQPGDLLSSALGMLVLEMRQRGYQIHVATVPSNLRFPDPITAFLYRATRSFVRQALGEGGSSLITVSVEGERASCIRVRAAINRETRSPGAESAPTFGSMIEMSEAGIQARGMLLGITVSVESSPGMTTALVLDVPLLAPHCS